MNRRLFLKSLLLAPGALAVAGPATIVAIPPLQGWIRMHQHVAGMGTLEFDFRAENPGMLRTRFIHIDAEL
jgi:hypothetical protein